MYGFDLTKINLLNSTSKAVNYVDKETWNKLYDKNEILKSITKYQHTKLSITESAQIEHRKSKALQEQNKINTSLKEKGTIQFICFYNDHIVLFV